jgi:hypothetical protein
VKKPRKPLTRKGKLIRLKILKFLFLVGPVLSIIIWNWKQYVPVQMPVEEKWQFPTGLVVAFIIIAILVINPSKKKIEASEMADMKLLFIVFIMSIILDPIIQDVKLMSGCALAGSFINYLFINAQIIKLQKMVDSEEIAEINADAIVRAQETVIKHSGRV